MSDTATITDRTLERLRLGELSEEESADILARLESLGEMHRLEELIQDDEAFLDRHPATPAASQIRERFRRRARSAPSPPANPRPRSTVAIPIAVAAILIALAVGSFIYDDRPPRRSDVAELAPAQTAPDDVAAPSAPSTPEPAPEPWTGLLDWVVTHQPDGVAAIACHPGQTMTLGAEGVGRVSVDQTSLLEVRASDDNAQLLVTCKESGLTTMNVFREDGTRTNIMVRIAPPFEVLDDDVAAMKDFDEALAGCGELSDVSIQVVVERVGYPSMIIVGGGTRSQRQCLREAAKTFRGGPERPPSDSPPYRFIQRQF